MSINIKKLSYQKTDSYTSSQLVLLFEGDGVNSSLVNTIRRLALTVVPTYAFCKKSIVIEKNTSIFNNDYMKLRISQMTYPNINSKIFYLPEKYWKKVNYSDPKREKLSEDKKDIQLYINVVNNSTENLNVTTATPGVDFYEDSVKKTPFDPNYPHLILQLRPKEEFVAKATAVLGVGFNSDIWNASANCYFEEVTSNKYKFFLESAGQIDERKIIIKSTKYIIKRLEYLKDIIRDSIQIDNDDSNKLIITLEDENHTIGYILNHYLQDNENVIFSGCSKTFLLINTMTIKLITKSKPIIIINNTIDQIIKIFNDIHKTIKTLKL